MVIGSVCDDKAISSIEELMEQENARIASLGVAWKVAQPQDRYQVTASMVLVWTSNRLEYEQAHPESRRLMAEPGPIEFLPEEQARAIREAEAATTAMLAAVKTNLASPSAQPSSVYAAPAQASYQPGQPIMVKPGPTTERMDTEPSNTAFCTNCAAPQTNPNANFCGKCAAPLK